ncbi:MAG TPA: hypothetical protein VGM41_20875 [Chitinophagaceae bacterium]|jgi:hypothetical protein
MKRLLLSLVIFLVSLSVDAQWSTNGSSITYYVGSVGINTSGPLGPLMVLGGTTYLQGVNLGYGSALGTIGTDASIKPISFQIGTTEYARLLANGSFGIGTTDTKGYLLAVNGPAVFTSAWVKPVGSWPDFVFNKNYSLPSLDSLSGYIQRHHHLPDIPSAENVQAKGIDLGGTQAALLKKIEELTLYIIAQNKEIEVLKEQSSRLKELEEKMARLENLIGEKSNN